MHTYSKEDLEVTPAFVEKFARRYIAQRTEKISDIASLGTSVLVNKTGFDTKILEKIINTHLIAIDKRRNKGKTPEGGNMGAICAESRKCRRAESFTVEDETRLIAFCQCASLA